MRGYFEKFQDKFVNNMQHMTLNLKLQNTTLHVRNLHALKNRKHLAYPNFKQIDLSKKIYIKNSICNALM